MASGTREARGLWAAAGNVRNAKRRRTLAGVRRRKCYTDRTVAARCEPIAAGVSNFRKVTGVGARDLYAGNAQGYRARISEGYRLSWARGGHTLAPESEARGRQTDVGWYRSRPRRASRSR